MIINFHTSITVQGNNTISKYITRYAPPIENDTKQYIQIVSQKTGIDCNDKIQFNVDTLKLILWAQFNVEIGPQFAALITNEDMNEGISRLNIHVSSFFNGIKKFNA